MAGGETTGLTILLPFNRGLKKTGSLRTYKHVTRTFTYVTRTFTDGGSGL